MDEKMTFTDITLENASYEGLFCVKNPNYPGFKLKLDWLKARQEEGLKMKLLKKDNDMVGFIEFVPGEYAWRPVHAANYLFIHCLWVFPKKNLGQGFGSLLIEEVKKEARKEGKVGVAVVTSRGSWMSDPEIYVKNGFYEISRKDRFFLMACKFKTTPDPEFINWDLNCEKLQGLNLVYANQCPLFIKSVDEMKQTAREFGLELKVCILQKPEEIRQAASGYGVYSLVYNGKLLADHYISNTRFKNILNKELINDDPCRED